MMNTPGWDKWFLDQLWSLLPGSLYMPTDKIGDWIYEDPDRFERILKTGDQIRGQRQAADDLIYYLGGLRDPKVIRILGPILFLEGDTFNYIDVSSYPSSERANTSLNDMDIYGLPEMGTLDDTRKWWLKNKDLTDEQWWELLRKGNEEIVKSRPAFDSMGHRNPPPPPRPAPVTPPPVLIPKPITPVPVQRLMPRPSPSTPLRQPQVPQLTSQAAAFWPRWLVVGTVTTGLGWLLLRGADDSPEH